MASLQGNTIKDTYKSLLKVADNGELEATAQEITDGNGNGTGVSLNTSGDVTAMGTVAFGSLKDSGENITITKFVDEADGIANNDNDSTIPTSAAVRDYVDNNITAQDLDISDGTNNGSVDLDSQSLLFTGDAGVSATVSGQTLTLDSSALQNQIDSNDSDISGLDGRLGTAETKLATIETGADVTDVTNVTAALNSISVTELNDVTNAGSGAIITTNERNKLAGIEAGAEVNLVDSVNAQTGAVVLDADDIDDSATTNKFTTQAEIDKLAGIESGAQVNTVDSVNGATGIVVLDADDIDDTSTTNKFVTSTDVTKLSNITITQAVDLDTIESDVAANTSKLSGIENGADVTDATNVAAAGAMMTDVALLNDLADVSGTPTDGQVLTYDSINGWQPESAGSAPVTSVNSETGDVVLDADDISDATTTNKFTTQAEIDKLAGIEAGADVTDSANVTTALGSISVTAHSDVTSAGSGAIITTIERDKLAGIEAGAEVNTVDSVNTQTGAVVLDADDIDDSLTTNKFVTAGDVTKLGHITVTQAVDLDTMESNIAVNASNISANDTDIANLQSDKYDKTGGVVSGDVTANSFIKSGGVSTEFLKADGSVDTNTYLTAEADTLDSVTDRGATTTNSITVGGISVTGTILDSNGEAGTSGQILSSTGTGTDWIDASGGGGSIDGSGTANYIAKWSDSDTLTDSVIYESAGKIAIGTTSILPDILDVRVPFAKTDTTRRDILYASNETTDPAGLRISITGGASQSARSSHLQTTEWGVSNNGNLCLQPFGGNVGIGTGNPLLNFQINSATDTNSTLAFSENNTLKWYIRNSAADDSLQFVDVVNTTERMRITSGGHVLIGTTTIGGQGVSFVENSGVGYYVATTYISSGTVTHYQFNNPNGAVGSITTSGSSTAYNTSSDYRLKENVVPMDGALDRVSQLQPSRFNFIADPETTVDGFLAHQVQAIVPEAVTGQKDAVEEYEVTPAVLDDNGNVIEEAVMGTRPVYQGIDQSKIVPLLVGAIQELKGLVQAQQAEIESLKSQLS